MPGTKVLWLAFEMLLLDRLTNALYNIHRMHGTSARSEALFCCIMLVAHVVMHRISMVEHHDQQL